MAITIVNSTATFNAAGSTTIASSAFNLSAGNAVTVTVRGATPTNFVTGMTDTAGNVYRFAGKTKGTTLWSEVWYCANCAGNASNVVTATFSASDTARAIALVQYASVATISPLDVLVNDFKTAASADITSTAFTTAVANSIVVAHVNISSTGTTWTASGGYSITVQDASAVQAIYTQVFSSIQTGVTVTAGNASTSQKTLITLSLHETLTSAGGGETSSVF